MRNRPATLTGLRKVFRNLQTIRFPNCDWYPLLSEWRQWVTESGSRKGSFEDEEVAGLVVEVDLVEVDLVVEVWWRWIWWSLWSLVAVNLRKSKVIISFNSFDCLPWNKNYTWIFLVLNEMITFELKCFSKDICCFFWTCMTGYDTKTSK